MMLSIPRECHNLVLPKGNRMPHFHRATYGLLAILLFSRAPSQLIHAESHWPRFRGPDGSGHYQAENLPTRWDAGDVKWRTELVGEGHSSACIWNDRIFLTAARRTDAGEVERLVMGIDAGDGRIIWQQSASVGAAEPLHGMNSFATATCASDGERVVAFFGRGGIHCYDMGGKRLWSHDLGTFPGPWGTGASPIIVDDLVIQNCDAAGEAHLTAFDKRTGETVWRTERGNLPRGGWNTPFVIDLGPRRELILNGEYGVRGYDPATGTEHWFCRGFNGRGTPTPAFGHGKLFVISGKPGDVYAVQPGGEGDVTESRMAWHTRRGGGRDLSSPILMGDHLFVVNMMGIGTCYDSTSGKELWQARLDGRFSASPIAADGLIYIQNEAGKTFVIKPDSAKLDIVAQNALGATEGEFFRSTLAPSAGRLYLRSNRAVYCVEKQASG
jgi:outer membrane protein assembly factor BamB